MDDDLDFFGHDGMDEPGQEEVFQEQIPQDFDDEVESDFIAELESIGSRDSDGEDADRIMPSQRGPLPGGFEFDTPGLQGPGSPGGDGPESANDGARARARRFQLDEDIGDLGGEEGEGGSSNRIYGTTLTQESIMSHCVDFIRQYEPNQDGVGKYDAELMRLIEHFLDQAKEDTAYVWQCVLFC